MKWRTGRKLGRSVYIGDELVGLMDTPQLARLVVDSVNASQAYGETGEAFCTCHYGTPCAKKRAASEKP